MTGSVTIARKSVGQLEEILTIERPFSLFEYIDRHFPDVVPVQRIMSQIRTLGGNTMVVEKVENATDVAEENEDLALSEGSRPDSSTVRLSFFRKRFKTSQGLSTAKHHDFLGFAIVKSDSVGATSRTRVFESVIRRSIHPNNCVRREKEWTCRVGASVFRVPGFLYAQQNAITNSCAHVAVKTAVSCYQSDRLLSYREMNRIVGIDHSRRKASEGLDDSEMLRILEAAGARCFVGSYTDPTANPPVPFQKYLYGSIESGFPAIICFETETPNQYHAILVFGHTFNEDTWVPRADSSYFRIGAGTRYIPSESWLSMFVGHDDNWGSNYCIPRAYLQQKRSCDCQHQSPGVQAVCPRDTSGIAAVISTVPKEVRLSPIQAEAIGVDYLFNMLRNIPLGSSGWDQRLKLYAANDKLVIRPILVSGKQYNDHLRRIRDWDGNKIHGIHISALKHILTENYYWLIEMSVPELFSANRRKICEVLLRSDKKPGAKRDFSNFILARFPLHFVLYDQGGPRRPQYSLVASGTQGHVELFGCEDAPAKLKGV